MPKRKSLPPPEYRNVVEVLDDGWGVFLSPRPSFPIKSGSKHDIRMRSLFPFVLAPTKAPGRRIALNIDLEPVGTPTPGTAIDPETATFAHLPVPDEILRSFTDREFYMFREATLPWANRKNFEDYHHRFMGLFNECEGRQWHIFDPLNPKNLIAPFPGEAQVTLRFGIYNPDSVRLFGSSPRAGFSV